MTNPANETRLIGGPASGMKFTPMPNQVEVFVVLLDNPPPKHPKQNRYTRRRLSPTMGAEHYVWAWDQLSDDQAVRHLASNPP